MNEIKPINIIPTINVVRNDYKRNNFNHKGNKI